MKKTTKRLTVAMCMMMMATTLQAEDAWKTKLAKDQFEKMGLTESVEIPVLDGEWQQLTGPPVKGLFNRETGDWYKSAVFVRPLDFAMWKARDGSWQIVSCVKLYMGLGNPKRVNRSFVRWEGTSPTDKNFKEMGIFRTVDTSIGESWPYQAPYVMMKDNKYYMFYNCGKTIRCLIGDDGKTFEPLKRPDGSFWDVPKCGRDVSVIYEDNKWYMYYCRDTSGSMCRVSDNFYDWSDEFPVAPGGESPFVLKYKDYFYYTQTYFFNVFRPLYMSKNLTDFGSQLDHTGIVGLFENDFKKTSIISGSGPKAYEIIEDNGQYYAAGYVGGSRSVKDPIEKQDRNGIWIIKIKWVKKTPEEILKWKIDNAGLTHSRTPLQFKQATAKDSPKHVKSRLKRRLNEGKVTKEEYDKQMSEVETQEEWKSRWGKLLKEENEMLNKKAIEGE